MLVLVDGSESVEAVDLAPRVSRQTGASVEFAQVHEPFVMAGSAPMVDSRTFSDIFAENYFPSAPFHGGFWLLSLHGVPKPTYRAFELLHDIGASRSGEP